MSRGKKGDVRLAKFVTYFPTAYEFSRIDALVGGQVIFQQMYESAPWF
jgi:hypothetical protein